MLYCLDTMIIIYAVDGNRAGQQRALVHLAGLEQPGQYVIYMKGFTEILDSHRATFSRAHTTNRCRALRRRLAL